MTSCICVRLRVGVAHRTPVVMDVRILDAWCSGPSAKRFYMSCEVLYLINWGDGRGHWRSSNIYLTILPVHIVVSPETVPWIPASNFFSIDGEGRAYRLIQEKLYCQDVSFVPRKSFTAHRSYGEKSGARTTPHPRKFPLYPQRYTRRAVLDPGRLIRHLSAKLVVKRVGPIRQYLHLATSRLYCPCTLFG